MWASVALILACIHEILLNGIKSKVRVRVRAHACMLLYDCSCWCVFVLGRGGGGGEGRDKAKKGFVIVIRQKVFQNNIIRKMFDSICNKSKKADYVLQLSSVLIKRDKRQTKLQICNMQYVRTNFIVSLSCVLC